MSTFQNAAAYERYMSGWSRAAGEPFLDWLALPLGLRWLDVGCGSGAFTALLAERAAPAELHGLDRSRCSPTHAAVCPKACNCTPAMPAPCPSRMRILTPP